MADYLSADQYNVISNEGLSSGLGGTLWYHRAQLLKEMIGPNCCVLIVIRNPLTYVKSWFGEYTKKNFPMTVPYLILINGLSLNLVSNQVKKEGGCCLLTLPYRIPMLLVERMWKYYLLSTFKMTITSFLKRSINYLKTG